MQFVRLRQTAIQFNPIPPWHNNNYAWWGCYHRSYPVENLRVAVDVGGTFTDVCIIDERTGKIRIEKTSSTPHDPIEGILNGIAIFSTPLNAKSQLPPPSGESS
jgi:hypothetical protein